MTVWYRELQFMKWVIFWWASINTPHLPISTGLEYRNFDSCMAEVNKLSAQAIGTYDEKNPGNLTAFIRYACIPTTVE